MAVWQPFIPTWMAKSEEPSPGNSKVWMSKRVYFRPLFPKLAKNYSSSSINTELMNRVALT